MARDRMHMGDEAGSPESRKNAKERAAELKIKEEILAKWKEGQDYYTELGVAQDAPINVIRDAYRLRVRLFHPDANPGDNEKTEKIFRAVDNAWKILKDGNKRKEYDRSLRDSNRRTTGESERTTRDREAFLALWAEYESLAGENSFAEKYKKVERGEMTAEKFMARECALVDVWISLLPPGEQNEYRKKFNALLAAKGLKGRIAEGSPETTRERSPEVQFRVWFKDWLYNRNGELQEKMKEVLERNGDFSEVETWAKEEVAKKSLEYSVDPSDIFDTTSFLLRLANLEGEFNRAKRRASGGSRPSVYGGSSEGSGQGSGGMSLEDVGEVYGGGRGARVPDAGKSGPSVQLAEAPEPEPSKPKEQPDNKGAQEKEVEKKQKNFTDWFEGWLKVDGPKSVLIQVREFSAQGRPYSEMRPTLEAELARKLNEQNISHQDREAYKEQFSRFFLGSILPEWNRVREETYKIHIESMFGDTSEQGIYAKALAALRSGKDMGDIRKEALARLEEINNKFGDYRTEEEELSYRQKIDGACTRAKTAYDAEHVSREAEQEAERNLQGARFIDFATQHIADVPRLAKRNLERGISAEQFTAAYLLAFDTERAKNPLVRDEDAQNLRTQLEEKLRAEAAAGEEALEKKRGKAAFTAWMNGLEPYALNALKGGMAYHELYNRVETEANKKVLLAPEQKRAGLVAEACKKVDKAFAAYDKTQSREYDAWSHAYFDTLRKVCESRLNDGEDPEKVKEDLRAKLENEVKAFTTQRRRNAEREFDVVVNAVTNTWKRAGGPQRVAEQAQERERRAEKRRAFEVQIKSLEERMPGVITEWIAKGKIPELIRSAVDTALQRICEQAALSPEEQAPYRDRVEKLLNDLLVEKKGV